MKQYNIAIVGATGAVGKIFIELLQSRKFPVKNLYPLGSDRSAGRATKAGTVTMQGLSRGASNVFAGFPEGAKPRK